MVKLSGFDASEVEPSTGFDPIPEGKYTAIITESEEKQTRAGNGSYLSLKFQIVEGKYQNRTLYTNLNLDNPNETAVKIARADLSAICRAVGVLQPQESAELHNKPMVITVKCKKRDDTGDIQNNISGYSKAGGSAEPAESESESTAPWKKK